MIYIYMKYHTRALIIYLYIRFKYAMRATMREENLASYDM